jgi:hypothetical protein
VIIKKLQNCHTVIDSDYYISAVKIIIEKTNIHNFLIFYEQEDYEYVIYLKI